MFWDDDSELEDEIGGVFYWAHHPVLNAILPSSTQLENDSDVEDSKPPIDDYYLPPSCLTQIHGTQSLYVEQKYLDCLLTEFGFTEFRAIQWNIIRSILQQNRDNCAIVATGYGKSLTFQFPAVYMGQIVVVASPLIALMEDQVGKRFLRNRACILGPANPGVEKDIIAFKYNIVYATPETLTSERGLSLLRALDDKLILVAIDEAHCISKWGHDFRPAFRRLSEIRKTVPNVPLLALTAVATPRVRNDICRVLGLRSPQILTSGYDRPNLEFTVRLRSLLPDDWSIWNDLEHFILWSMRMNGSAIIYCNTVKHAQMVAGALEKHVPCHCYHSRMTNRERKKKSTGVYDGHSACNCGNIGFRYGNR